MPPILSESGSFIMSFYETERNPVQKFCGILIGKCHVLLTRLRNRKYELLKLKNSRFAYFLKFP